MRSGYRDLVITTLLITPSGALSPGPLSASAVAVGASMGIVGGFLVALGHMSFELPYVILLYKFSSGVKEILARYRVFLNIVVIIFLLLFSYLLIRDALSILSNQGSGMAQAIVASPLTAFATGFVLTGFNAYFLLWWLTIGYVLVEKTTRLGARGFAAMYTSHVWMDYAWLMLLAAGGEATRILGREPYATLLIALAIILIYFASRLIATLLPRRIS